MSFISDIFRPHIWPRIAFLISLGMLCSAWAFQYLGGLAPCQMCYWQRHGHKAVLAVSLAVIIALALRGRSRETILKIGLWLIALAFAVSSGLGAWHMGVEHGWWEGPKTCMVGPIGPITMGGFEDSLKGPIKMPACSDVVWSLFGLSMAGWNALVSGVAALISISVATRKGDL